ncbi:MAG: hypothetical protein OEY01_04415 [Desulfobulbaceae bacterium]|nr:hypothetical protein [Desulfobulbaceae bacterium]HIJ78424.1 hypothetical protein [Deltaproteobacteria bacterium]
MKLRVFQYLAALPVMAGLVICARFNFLVFHSLAEVFSVVIACGVFMFAWNTRKLTENDFFLFLGIAFLFVGSLDLLHALSYKGMGVFVGFGANLPTQLWIVARYLQAVSFLIAPLFLTRRLNFRVAFVGYFIIWASALYAVFSGAFPDCFVEGVGLTPFKKISEYLISGVLVSAYLLLYKNRLKLDFNTYRLVVFSIILTIVSEVAFTFYVSVYGLSNLVGHLFKIVAFYLIYHAIIAIGLRRPYECLQLREEELKKINKKLASEIDFRKKLEMDKENVILQLKNALSEVRTLRDILPICSFCKKIRDDDGCWDQLEVYITNHSDTDFSHGICPDCLEEHYPKELEEMKNIKKG